MRYWKKRIKRMNNTKQANCGFILVQVYGSNDVSYDSYDSKALAERVQKLLNKASFDDILPKQHYKLSGVHVVSNVSLALDARVAIAGKDDE